ncbi:LacI family DNA-binding transcriptional regulator [Brucella sp. NBRC 12950]|uniref:LacI family DNA-binding transcriptional regulator n=1 Tax=Brucella sp. NBRC 12950 TaxID=2994518 RepID=UPI0024A1FD44|nr:LacI family DNA-binding transcriptional regulator [Brucella sp. NBRC 12950]GLU28081.1 transcriptional regulator [Brucella sp. NBRC 12950]
MKNSKATLADVAKAAGVSPATVSRAISNPELVRQETLRTIRAVAKSLGYIPDAKARALVSGRSNSVGVVVPTLDSPMFSRALHAMQKALSNAGFQLLVASHDYDPFLEELAASKLIGQGVDGLVLVGADRPEGLWKLVDGTGTPTVLTWCAMEGRDSVCVDNVKAGELVANHLLDLGHRHFGVLTGERRNNDRQRQRLEGVRNALERRGVPLGETNVLEQPISIAGGRSGCNRLLTHANTPTAIIGLIDILATGAMIEAQAQGIAVPTDMSIAGIDNLEFSEHVAPALTTVHIPAANMGDLAAMRILEMLRAPQTPRSTMLDVELIARKSTAPPRG